MASISNLTFPAPEPAGFENVKVNVKYTIVWSNFDRNSRQPYRERVLLVGEDANNVFTPLPDTTLSFDRVASNNGAATEDRSFSATIPRASLQEDPPGNDDEIKARVTLTPIAAAGDEQLSARQVIPG